MEKQIAIAYLEENYSLPATPDDWFSYDNFRAQLLKLDFTSTPGLPYMREAPTIGKWLGWDGIQNFNEFQVMRLWHDVNLVLTNQYEHVFRAFVKDEPHKVAKVREHRWRLIMCASLPVQMLWRLALHHQNSWLNDHPYECPSGHGLVFCYGGWRRFKAHCHSKSLRYSRDISSWDVNAPGWVFEVVREFRKRAGGPASWLAAMDLLYADAFEKALIKFSNGVVVRQTYSGTMKSGLFVTISDNSLSMIAMHCLACVRSRTSMGHIWATGDDVLQSNYSEPYEDSLAQLGCTIKEWETELVFMGTNFEREPEPLYFNKHIVNWWSNEENMEERLDAYCRLYSYTPYYHFWKILGQHQGIKVRSQSYYQFWYSSPFAKLTSYFR